MSTDRMEDKTQKVRGIKRIERIQPLANHLYRFEQNSQQSSKNEASPANIEFSVLLHQMERALNEAEKKKELEKLAPEKQFINIARRKIEEKDFRASMRYNDFISSVQNQKGDGEQKDDEGDKDTEQSDIGIEPGDD